MTLPENFDQNEWFIIIGVVITYTLVILFPKRFPLSMVILVMLFAIICARVTDHMMASPAVNYYDIMDTGSYELFDLLVYIFYAPFSYFFVYFLEKFKIRDYWQIGYIILWSFIAIGFESVNVYFDVFNYHEWRLTYSFPMYFVIQIMTMLFYYFIKHHYYLLKNKQ
ncbi:hypothetical protein SAMN05421676_104157 [Salinibacillus kushneri]|uniref:Uncharacterized protein n=1 Tax=Salinibacillus kushneri TaxID=237682 RepID=A0A1I0DT54_9BACI|nr:hypothetical protein [Salinibacillus kushneri]SET35775.1 hypothetical protein SAMN05421676_104157 [Salinibacillus kushneri]